MSKFESLSLFGFSIGNNVLVYISIENTLIGWLIFPIPDYTQR